MPVEMKKRRPRKRRWRRFREGDVPRGTYIVPNLFTTANLFSGFFGIVNAIDRHFEVAGLAILASCVFDILDGKVARLTRATSRFGVEYDSLSDLVSFGVGPGSAHVPVGVEAFRTAGVARRLRFHGVRRASARPFQRPGGHGEQQVLRRAAHSGRGQHGGHHCAFRESLDHDSSDARFSDSAPHRHIPAGFPDGQHVAV